MSAPTYRVAPHKHVWRTGLFRVDWEVTDGIGGRLLAYGHRWTATSAHIDAINAEVACKPSLELRLEWVADRLEREGLRVEVRIDERDRVCVRPLCPCSTPDRMRIVRAFLAITARVALACTKHESPVESCEWCRCFAGVGGAR